MSAATIQLVVVVAYFAALVLIGTAAFRRTSATPEDYFLGGRTAKSVVLFMALLGTNVTPFLLMGIPGMAYHQGIGVFGYNAAIVAFAVPLTFYAIGYPAWIAAKQTGAVTPAELYARRLNSPTLGRVMFAVYFVYTLAYMVTGVSGVGLAVDVFTRQTVSFEAAAAGILIITVLYTSLGGMRATMWTNVFQGAVFALFLIFAFFAITADFGGVAAAAGEVERRFPHLLMTPNSPPFDAVSWASWAVVMAFAVISFPHMLIRVFAAKDATSLKNSVRFYPFLMTLLFLFATVLGLWGRLEFADFQGRESDQVFPLLIQNHLGPWMQGLALAGILAAVMSTLDAQILTLSSMLTRDVVGGLSERRQVVLGRVFGVALGGCSFLIAAARPASIFSIAGVAFSGYITLIPTLWFGLRWRSATAVGAIASIVTGNVVMIAAYNGWWWDGGVHPGAWGLVAAAVAFFGGSRLTTPPPAPHVEAMLGPIDRAFGVERADTAR